MKNSTAFGHLKAKLATAGCTIEPIKTAAVAADTSYGLFLVYRKTNPPLRIMVIDQPENGYSLFLEQPTMAIDGDVAAILAADPRAQG